MRLITVTLEGETGRAGGTSCSIVFVVFVVVGLVVHLVAFGGAADRVPEVPEEEVEGRKVGIDSVGDRSVVRIISRRISEAAAVRFGRDRGG